MKKMMTALSVLLLFGMSTVWAETGTTMILVSDNYADCAVAEALAEETGGTIIKTTWGEFEQTVLDTIIETNPEEVMVIGGPMAVLDDYITRLEDAAVTVERLSGQTRQQTSLAVFNRYRTQYNLSAAVGDGREPYREEGRFPVWFFDDEGEIDTFIQERRATVMNYGMAQRFAGRYGTPRMDVTSAQVQNFGMQIQERIHVQYDNSTWVRQRVGMETGGRMGMGG